MFKFITLFQGQVTFNKNGIRTVTKLGVLQYRRDKQIYSNVESLNKQLIAVPVAQITENTTFKYVDGWDINTVWKGIRENELLLFFLYCLLFSYQNHNTNNYYHVQN